jgi:tubulin polyglutamylase TTLL6/13
MCEIREIITKTIAAVQPVMAHSYRISRPNNENLELCFEILGFDIIIDQDMKPWLLEVNHTPSFQTDSNLDFQIKHSLLIDTIILL